MTRCQSSLLTALCLLLLTAFTGCGEPEPGGPGRTAGSRAGIDSSGEFPPPKIEFDATEHDFGIIEPTDLVSHRFTFHNRGESLLFIHKVRPS